MELEEIECEGVDVLVWSTNISVYTKKKCNTELKALKLRNFGLIWQRIVER
jgi:hypothetical protein